MMDNKKYINFLVWGFIFFAFYLIGLLCFLLTKGVLKSFS